MSSEPTPRIFFDDEIRQRVSAVDAIAWMGEAIDEHHGGRLIAPARVQADLDDQRLIFTAGRLRGSWYGYRSYGAPSADRSEHVVVVHDEQTGVVRGVAIGNELGPRRTGAIGGVAVDALTPRTASSLAIIGTGAQAVTQLWAISAVRSLREVKVFSRNEQRRADFVRRAAGITSAPCHSTTSARDALQGADIVILATTSATAVIDTEWLEPHAYVATLGPKQRDNAEFSPDLTAAAGMIVTDSLAQIDSYDPPCILFDTQQRDRVVSLGEVRAGGVANPTIEGITLFFSVGLAGTEVFLLDQLVKSTSSR